MSKAIKWIPNIKEPYTLHLMISDPRTRRYPRMWAVAIMGVMLAYTFSPLDIIPDTIPIIGWMDDLVLVPIAFILIEKILPKDILAENRKVASLSVNRAILTAVLAISAFLALWGLIITTVVLLVIRLIHV